MRSLPISGLILLFAALLPGQDAGVTQPSLIYRAEPEYSAEATRARVQSAVLLSIVVGEDGLAHDIHVVKGAGFGLDEKAIEAMEKWRFNPGTRDGHIADMPANVEMNFGIQAKNDTEDRSGQRARLNFTLPPGASRPELIVGKLPADPSDSGDQSLSFHLEVDAQGVPKNVTVLSSSDPAWGKQVQRVVQTWRFRPALLDAGAVPVEGVFEIEHSGPPETPEANVIVPSVTGPDEAPAPRPMPAPLPIPGLVARVNHTATLLTNGTVLLVGGASLDKPPGSPSREIASAQTFDWATRSIANTGNLLTARQNHTATLLPDGTVFIAGGDAGGHPLASNEIFDPSTGKFSQAASLRVARQSHAAALLPGGRVLICGGTGIDGKALNSAEIYDPRVKTFVPAGEMTTPRTHFSAVTLKDGRVLLVGGAGASAEIFDPESGAFSAAASMTTARYGFSATRLNNGQVLIAGGGPSAKGGESATVEIYDPASNLFHTAASMTWARDRSTGTLLNSGKVLIVGGSPQTEIYDPVSGTFGPGPLLADPQAGATATLLENGNVLVAGGSADLLMVR